MKRYNIAIVGATGAVGLELMNCLSRFKFPYNNIKLLASKKSAGKEFIIDNNKYYVEELTKDSFKDVDIAIWSAGGNISKEYMPYALEAKCLNIDNTSYFRMNKDVPLVVPEVNSEALKDHKGIIANPNCTTIQLVSALNRLEEYFDIERIVISTYQAVSGAGVAGMDELYQQSQAVLNNEEVIAKVLPSSSDKLHYPIAFNCIPQVDLFDLDNAYTKEEMKIVNETQKIFNKKIKINATCVRVPVLRGHSESVYIETKKEIDIDKVFELLSDSEGVVLYDDIANQKYPMASILIGDVNVYVGRVRKDLDNPNGLSLWIVADQLLKGAAYNSVDIALKMIEMNLIEKDYD